MTEGKAVRVIGAGGHAKVVIRALQAAGYTIAALYDDNPALQDSRFCGVPVVGRISALNSTSTIPCVIAIGDNRRRLQIASELKTSWASAIHPSAIIDSTAVIHPGAMVMAGAVIQADVVVEAHAIVNTAASIDHDCKIRAAAHVAPGVILAGNCEVLKGSFLGAGSTVIPGVKIGPWSTVGAGAVVISDIETGQTAIGVPAKTKAFSGSKDPASTANK